MSYKKMDNNFSFADLSLSDSFDRNRSVSRMENQWQFVNWSSIESLLLKHYTVGKKCLRCCRLSSAAFAQVSPDSAMVPY